MRTSWHRYAIVGVVALMALATLAVVPRVGALRQLTPEEVAIHYWQTWNPLERRFLSAGLAEPDSVRGARIAGVHANGVQPFSNPAALNPRWTETHLIAVQFVLRGNEGGDPDGGWAVLVGKLDGEDRYRVLDYGEECKCGSCWLGDKYPSAY